MANLIDSWLVGGVIVVVALFLIGVGVVLGLFIACGDRDLPEQSHGEEK